ncbi:MAG: N-acyl homoserine lactonase family protein [Sphaerochaetaceae bacterium]
MKTYAIYPHVTMIMDNNELSMFTYMQNYGVKVSVPVMVWLIKGNGRNILVDTGASRAEEACKYHYPSHQTPDMYPENQIQKNGVKPEDVDAIILTHLHWDHCYNLDKFPNAKIYVQKCELEYAENPLPCHRGSYEIRKEIPQPWPPFRDRFIVMDGDWELAEGINVYHLPGHTPGMQNPVINTNSGTYLLGTDNVALYKNWEGDGKGNHLPGTISCNMFDYYHSLKRMEGLCDHVLPGHDIQLLDLQPIE